MNITELIATVKQLGFHEIDFIRRMVRPTVTLQPVKSSDDSSLTRSKFGGLPALPASYPWPKYKDQSLAFIGQVDLGSIPEVMREQGFPSEGMLLFFYDADQRTWGFDPKDAGSFAVIYISDYNDESLVTQLPDDISEEARFKPCILDTHQVAPTLPPWESLTVDDLNLSDEQMSIYMDVLDTLCDDDEWANRGLLGGYLDQIQGDVMLDCELTTAGFYCGDDSAYKDKRFPWFRQKSRDWRLLLQVPSCEEAGMMWGDMGCLYYCIRDEDLRNRRFDRVWMVLQCG
jgi:uncharacterized protein YwqG